MNLIKLLLIGLLSVVALSACSDTLVEGPADGYESFVITGTGGLSVKVGESNQLQTVEKVHGQDQGIKNISIADGYQCVSAAVKNVQVSGSSCVVTGVGAGTDIPVVITNVKFDSYSRIVYFTVTE